MARGKVQRRRSMVFGGTSAALLLVTALAATVLTASSPAASNPVAIANAGVLGSLVTALKTAVPGVTITNTTGGSVALAQNIESGTQAADIFGSADASVNQFLLGDANKNKVRWFAAFARNAIVMQYSPAASDPHHADFVAAAAGTEPWYQGLITGPAINLCRMSPDADPSGYYTLFVMQLAEAMYPSVATQLKQVLGDDRNPVQTSSTCTQGKSITNGTLDVNFTYLSSALSSTTGNLRPFFNLRSMQVSTFIDPIDPGRCSVDRLAVSGDGVTVSDVSRKGGQCTITVDVAPGQTGVRDLLVLNKAGGKVQRTFTGAVNLLEAVPVVPDFLPDTTPAVPPGPPVTISTAPGNGITPITPVTLTTADLAALPQQTYTVTINGTPTTERGPTLTTLLARAGVTFNASCKNDELRYWIQATGGQGTAAEVTAGENDTVFGNNPGILSLFENGTALPAPRLIMSRDATSVRDISGVLLLTVGRAAAQLADTATPACTAAPFTAPVTAPAPGSVLINGDVAHPATLTFAQLQSLPQVTQTDTFMAGANPTTVTETGPTLFSVLAAAEPEFQFCAPNDNTRFYVEVTSSEDGYASVLSWAEIDPFLNGNQVLLSLSENGASQQSFGPRLTLPGDIKGGRYVSGTAVITVFRVPDAAPVPGCPSHP